MSFEVFGSGGADDFDLFFFWVRLVISLSFGLSLSVCVCAVLGAVLDAVLDGMGWDGMGWVMSVMVLLVALVHLGH